MGRRTGWEGGGVRGGGHGGKERCGEEERRGRRRDVYKKVKWYKILVNSPALVGHGSHKLATCKLSSLRSSELNLHVDEAKQCQYLKHDTLYFSIVSDISQSCKPWLTSIN